MIHLFSVQSIEKNPHFQFFLPKWASRMLGLSFFKVEPVNRLGTLFRQMLRERKLNGLQYNDLAAVLDEAIEKGLEMDEDAKLGNSR